VSNLNRQLLFRSQHVGQPKCVVACQVAQELAIDEGAVFQAHHGNVCDNSRFNVQFLAPFDVILSALDNVGARQRVNRLALAAAKPLVEAGTTGYLGQCNVLHKASGTACYECYTKETGKVYPICTIRSTPSAPVHCIVWAKELYKLLFGEKMEESMLYETSRSEEEPSTYMNAVDELRGGQGTPPDGVTAAALSLIRALYITEIQKQIDMDRYKTATVTPTVLVGALLTVDSLVLPPTSFSTYRTTEVWSPAQCVAELVDCISYQDAKLPVFDKDDDLAMRFVTAASNLRMIVFGITPVQSLYSAKGIAGNIIPAIATTNAIVAGLQILQTFHILKAQMEGRGEQLGDCCHYINCIRLPVRNGLYLTSGKLDKPNPACFVCSKANVPLNLKIAEWTLRDLLDKVVKKDLGFEAPSILIESDTIWEEGDGADTEAFVANLDKKLTDLPCGGIQNGTLVLMLYAPENHFFLTFSAFRNTYCH
jgi:ubiquitin-like 1-activating enzyme E1 B